jgi:predicted nucleic acid-binding protein
LETEAVETILFHAELGDWYWVGSEAMVYEIANLADFERRGRVLELLGGVREWIRTDAIERHRVEALMALGFKPLDAMHVASGESAEVEVVLTTDDRLLRTAQRRAGELSVRVANPLRWLEEQIR